MSKVYRHTKSLRVPCELWLRNNPIETLPGYAFHCGASPTPGPMSSRLIYLDAFVGLINLRYLNLQSGLKDIPKLTALCFEELSCRETGLDHPTRSFQGLVSPLWLMHCEVRHRASIESLIRAITCYAPVIVEPPTDLNATEASFCGTRASTPAWSPMLLATPRQPLVPNGPAEASVNYTYFITGYCGNRGDPRRRGIRTAINETFIRLHPGPTLGQVGRRLHHNLLSVSRWSSSSPRATRPTFTVPTTELASAAQAADREAPLHAERSSGIEGQPQAAPPRDSQPAQPWPDQSTSTINTKPITNNKYDVPTSNTGGRPSVAPALPACSQLASCLQGPNERLNELP
ncbi:leucine-rich repeat-containing protein 4B [Lates japonicus]|uniref:Leucine-rich repeat-containing protein 4B n=1 Tax=Lates japonicus TaxID=270547 RepID=A0AAD3M7V3_LATJO|nr:leucine-rich repeat-containing protein 4B [Lates japonicus]